MPKADAGKAIACHNTTTPGFFAHDVALPSLGEDPNACHQFEGRWTTQLVSYNLLEQHSIEEIAASWRLRRLHHWQAQLHEDNIRTESDRLNRLKTVLRYEAALHRQIDTAVCMLTRDVPQLYARRLRKAIAWAAHDLSAAPLDTSVTDNVTSATEAEPAAPVATDDTHEICQNEPPKF